MDQFFRLVLKAPGRLQADKDIAVEDPRNQDRVPGG
jgi:hypothetical protein